MWNNNADVTDVLIMHIAKWHHITRCSHIVLHVFFFWVFFKKVFLFVCFGGEMSVCPTPAQVEPASLPEL